MNCLSVVNHFVGLALEVVNFNNSQPIYACKHHPCKKECMQVDFSTRRRPECQTLSKTFDISGATALIASEMLKALGILSVANVNYLQSFHKIGC